MTARHRIVDQASLPRNRTDFCFRDPEPTLVDVRSTAVLPWITAVRSADSPLFNETNLQVRAHKLSRLHCGSFLQSHIR